MKPSESTSSSNPRPSLFQNVVWMKSSIQPWSGGILRTNPSPRINAFPKKDSSSSRKSATPTGKMKKSLPPRPPTGPIQEKLVISSDKESPSKVDGETKTLSVSPALPSRRTLISRSPNEELRTLLEGSHSLAKKRKQELDCQKRYFEELKEALETAMHSGIFFKIMQSLRRNILNCLQGIKRSRREQKM